MEHDISDDEMEEDEMAKFDPDTYNLGKTVLDQAAADLLCEEDSALVKIRTPRVGAEGRPDDARLPSQH